MNSISVNRHSVSGLFVFFLLGIFAVFSTITVLLGARVYRSITQNQAAHNLSRIAPAYLRSMIRSADEKAAFTIKEIDDNNDMLIITQTYEDETTNTYIYCYNGLLRECFISTDMGFEIGDGEEVCALDGLRFAQLPGLLHVTLISEDEPTEMNIALYAAL